MVAPKKQVRIAPIRATCPASGNVEVMLFANVHIFHFAHLTNAEKGFGVDQCASGAGHEVRQVLPGLQADAQVAASGQG